MKGHIKILLVLIAMISLAVFFSIRSSRSTIQVGVHVMDITETNKHLTEQIKEEKAITKVWKDSAHVLYESLDSTNSRDSILLLENKFLRHDWKKIRDSVNRAHRRVKVYDILPK